MYTARNYGKWRFPYLSTNNRYHLLPMLNDKTTLKDLSMISATGTADVFTLIDHTITQQGRDALRRMVTHPPDSFETLFATQQAIKFLAKNADKWPAIISNGTLVMLEKFFEAADSATAPPAGINNLLGGFFQKILNRQQYFFTQFSISHLSDFLKGCSQIAALSQMPDLPPMLQREFEQIARELEHRLTEEVIGVNKQTKFNDLALISYRARREMKNMVFRLMAIYARLDAWQSMARATALNNWAFPTLQPALPLTFSATQLHHPLLGQPIGYDINLGEQHNFMVLTGANMSGKTTFMRALGLGSLLAHLGMGVPAKSMRISFLRGIITNMHVEDNLLKGESYFFAEVQRMKQTAEKLLQDQPHLVLMDELFKGTNVHDAFECTRGVMEGLLHHNSHLMILSTHLYEVAHLFSNNTAIQFAYFVTETGTDDNYHFTYELKSGISNDRIGYRILQKEGVISLLNRRKTTK